MEFSIAELGSIVIDYSETNKKHVNTRDCKGQSLISFPNKYIILDLETTGLSPKCDEIIEVSALKIDNDIVTDIYSSLIKPSEEISTFITELTGITNEMLSEAPSFDSISQKLFDFLKDKIIVGHNINFDINFLYDNFYKSNLIFDNDFIDTMRIARKLLPELSHHRLKDLMKIYDITTDKQHRALEDCQATLQIYKELKKTILNEFEDYNEFINLFKHKHNSYKRATSNTETTALFLQKLHNNPDSYLFDKNCVFTGTLDKMNRKDAIQAVINIGGNVQNNINKNTDILILGDNDYCPSIKDGKSNKQKKAEEYILKGIEIEIMPENVFYDLLLDDIRKENL